MMVRLGYFFAVHRVGRWINKHGLLVAVVLFVLAALGVNLGGIALVPLGLAAFAASGLVGP